MRFVKLFLFLAFMPISVPSFSADRQQAIDAYNRGDYQTAVQIIRPLAEGGDAQSQHDLGWMHFSGLGVSQNDTKAATWYRLSAEQGFAKGQSSLGYMYEFGRGVVQSH